LTLMSFKEMQDEPPNQFLQQVHKSFVWM
jgi:hypothetical protein